MTKPVMYAYTVYDDNVEKMSCMRIVSKLWEMALPLHDVKYNSLCSDSSRFLSTNVE